MFASFDVVGYEFYDGVRNVCSMEFMDEVMEVDGIEGFAHVECYCYGALRWLVFVESGGDGVVYVV